jgi:hypothetical protein
MSFRIGDLVGYKSTLRDQEFHHIGKVREVLLDGIPLCQEPMVMLEGKAGVVLASHCTVIHDVKEGA